MIKNIVTIIFILMTNAYAIDDVILKSETTFNPSLENRFSLMFGVNPSLQKSSDVTNFLFSYGKKQENFWLDATVCMTSAFFNKISTNNSLATGLDSSLLYNTSTSLTTLGLGIGRETRYAQTLLPFEEIYELMSADLTYNIFNESVSGKSFTGPGLLAKFSLYKKFSDYMSLGTQFTYNLASVKRAAEVDTETSSSRALTLSYLTLGFDLSFYL